MANQTSAPVARSAERANLRQTRPDLLRARVTLNLPGYQYLPVNIQEAHQLTATLNQHLMAMVTSTVLQNRISPLISPLSTKPDPSALLGPTSLCQAAQIPVC